MSKKIDDKFDYSIKVSFSKTEASIEFGGDTPAGPMAHGIALLILALNNQVEGDIMETFSGVVDAIKNINGDG